MATLLLQVEVDSEVHPELYAVLAAVGRATLRPERLRQLAGGGLIWEHLRAQPRLDAGSGPSAAEHARASAGSALSRALAQPRPAPAYDDAPEAAEPPPVLDDVVEMGAPPARPRARAPAPPAAPVATPRRTERAPVVAPPEEDLVDEDLDAVGAEDIGAAPAPAPDPAGRRAGPRSRLLLMKERGMFRNS